jgi:hypothetical protein
MSATTNTARRASDKPLLSHSSILILSGFLIGMVSRNAVRPGDEMLVYAAGVVGLVSYLGLGLLARARKQRATNHEFEQASTRLEKRINRHVARSGPIKAGPKTPKLPRSDRQYLTVVRSHEPNIV